MADAASVQLVALGLAFLSGWLAALAVTKPRKRRDQAPAQPLPPPPPPGSLLREPQDEAPAQAPSAEAPPAQAPPAEAAALPPAPPPSSAPLFVRGSLACEPTPRELDGFIRFVGGVLDEAQLNIELARTIETRVVGLGTRPEPRELHFLLRAVMCATAERLRADVDASRTVLAIGGCVLTSLLRVHTRPHPETRAALFFPSRDAYAYVLNVLRGARTSIDVCVYTVTDREIGAQLAAAHRRGVSVRLITDDKKAFDTGSVVFRLVEAGIPTVVGEEEDGRDRPGTEPPRERHMHHKFAVVDARALLTGSFNWTHAAHERNCENLLVTDDAYFVHKYAETFERHWNDFRRENRLGRTAAALRIQALYRGKSFRRSFSRDSFARLSRAPSAAGAAEPLCSIESLCMLRPDTRGGGRPPLPAGLRGLYSHRRGTPQDDGASVASSGDGDHSAASRPSCETAQRNTRAAVAQAGGEASKGRTSPAGAWRDAASADADARSGAWRRRPRGGKAT